MENSDLQRQLEFPMVDWKWIAWYQMTGWSEFSKPEDLTSAKKISRYASLDCINMEL